MSKQSFKQFNEEQVLIENIEAAEGIDINTLFETQVFDEAQTGDELIAELRELGLVD